MAGSDDSGVVLSASDGPSESSEVSASKKIPTMSSDDAVESDNDAIPTKLDESSLLPAPETKGNKSQSEGSETAEAHTDDKEEPLTTPDDPASRDSDVDDGDLSEGSDVDLWLDLYRIKFDGLKERIKLAPKRVKQVNQYSRILEERLVLLEKRATAFDKKLRRLEDGDDELPPPPPPPDETGLHLKPELNFQLSKGLKPPKPADDEKPIPFTHQIDVFVGEPEAQKVEKFRRQETGTNILEDQEANDKTMLSDLTIEHSSKSFDERRLVEEMAKIKNKLMPNRIRINSLAMLCLFRKFNTGDNDRIDDVILRPFKPLLRNKEEIFNIMSEVEKALTRIVTQRANKNAESITDPNESNESKDSKDANDPKDVSESNNTSTSEVAIDIKDGRDSEDPNEVNDRVKKRKARKDSKKAHPAENENYRKFKSLQNGPDGITEEEWNVVLKQLELFDDNSGCCGRNMKGWPALSEVKKSFDCFRDLFNNYLLPCHREFREYKAKKVRFCDLWHLFQTGDLVVTKRLANLDETETQDQLGMRVLMTSGGRRVILPKMPAPVYSSLVKLSASKDKVEPINGINPFCIHAYYLDFNGSRLVPIRRRIVIAPYLGERNIMDLEVIPIKYSSNTADILQERGKKFIESVTASTAPYVDCKGLELRTREEIDDKVIVDMKGYLSVHPSDMPSFQEPEELDVSETSDCFQGAECNYACISCYHRTQVVHDQMTDLTAYQEYVDDKAVFNPLSATPSTGLIDPSDFIICHYRIFAYKLRAREWVHVNVKNLVTPKEIDKSTGFEKLVLAKDHKDILESQVREHFRKKDSQTVGRSSENDMDLVRGKGQGLIILLHGAPGVGKTATAECIADLMEKPLYPITCGDLGSSADDVEKNLKKHFTLASRWDCVMLLDEADVFLARRNREDLQRNSIVSVFLRMLEYYKGLLFLTTNRVGTLDEAFTSRVHISLFYPDFTKKTTLAVWQTFIDQTVHVLEKSGRTHVTINGPEIIKFAKKHWKETMDSKRARWNGRQIRNAFHTALAMAEFNARAQKDGADYDESKDVKISVGKEQFEKIAKTAREFDNYMMDTMGTTYEEKASKEGLRKEQKKEEEKGKKNKKKKSSKSKKESDSSSSESESDDDDDAKKKKKKKKKQSKSKKQNESSSSESESEDGSDSNNE